MNESSQRTPRQFIQKWMELLTQHLLKKKIFSKQEAAKEITLVFLDKTAAKKINKQFRKKNYATDVLSFESEEPTSLGELILCPEVLKHQAREHKLSYQQELGYMLLHGVLHLLGYDHETNESDAEKMFRLQDDLFEILLKKIK